MSTPSPSKRTRPNRQDHSESRNDSNVTRTTRNGPQIIMVSSNVTPSRRGSSSGRGRARGRGQSATNTPNTANSQSGPRSRRAGVASATPSPTKPSATTSSKGKGREVIDLATPSKSKSPSKRARNSTTQSQEASEDDDGSSSSSSAELDGSVKDPDEEEGADDSDGDNGQKGRSSKSGKLSADFQLPEISGESSVRRTASDVYFYLTSKPSKTSSNVFSSLLPRLTREECTALLAPHLPASASSSAKSSSKSKKTIPNPNHIYSRNPGLISSLQSKLESQYPSWAFQLHEGFNLMFYGLGSKINVLNDFAKRACAGKGHTIVIINGFWSPLITLKSLLEAIEQQLPDLIDLDQEDEALVDRSRVGRANSALSALELRANKIHRYFLPASPSHTKRLFLVIHNIDYLRPNSLMRATLALLASSPHIHLIASVDNVHVASGMWTIPEMVGRMPFHRDQLSGEGGEDTEDQEEDNPAPLGSQTGNGFAWLWHEAHTFEPYDVELSFRDTSALPRMKKSSALGPGGFANGDDDGDNITPMTESAAQQVLTSVTQKARKLFQILGHAQLGNSSDSSNATEMGNKSQGMSYDMLIVRAREEFLATTDTALRALLTEFRDHGLVRRSSAGSSVNAGGTEGGKVAGDIFWIPLTKDVLRKLLDGMKV